MLRARVPLVDSAATTAQAVATRLSGAGLLRGSQTGAGRRGRSRFLATDGAERVAGVGGIFPGRPLAVADVELIDA